MKTRHLEGIDQNHHSTARTVVWNLLSSDIPVYLMVILFLVVMVLK